MSQTTLKTQTKQFNVVLNIPNSISSIEFANRVIACTEKLNSNGLYYAYIYHDKDLNHDNTAKRLHVHLVISSNHRTRLETMLYRLADYLGYDEDINLINTIQIDKCETIQGSIQYLTHKNDKDKYQYEPSAICTNFPNSTFAEYYYTRLTQDSITMLTLIDWVLEGYSDIEIMCFIGASRFRIYEYCLKEIRKRFNTINGIESLKELKEKLCKI